MEEYDGKTKYHRRVGLRSSSCRERHEMALKILPRMCLALPSKDIIKEWAA